MRSPVRVNERVRRFVSDSDSDLGLIWRRVDRRIHLGEVQDRVSGRIRRVLMRWLIPRDWRSRFRDRNRWAVVIGIRMVVAIEMG